MIKVCALLSAVLGASGMRKLGAEDHKSSIDTASSSDVEASLNNSAFSDFCWLDSYGRGAGTIPRSCESGYDRIGLFCYKKCGSGWTRFGFDCHTKCPSGWRNDGLFCRQNEYGRGFGYTLWKKKKCNSEHSQGCERCLALYYPKCKPGYKRVGCNICRPESRPDCAAFNLGGGFGLSCAKRIEIGRPRTGTCASNEDKDAGLCYRGCNNGYNGVGPVCWGEPPRSPRSWVRCGLGAATTQRKCAEITAKQLFSVGSLALKVGTLGGLSAATNAKDAGKIRQAFSKLKAEYNKIKNIPQVKAALEKGEKVKKFYDEEGKKWVYLHSVMSRSDKYNNEHMTAADQIRAASEVMALMDPTGVMSVVTAYTYPKCSKL